MPVYKYTDKEIKTLMDSAVILVDTREQENGHILDHFTKRKIQHTSRKLDYGDYSLMLPACPELGVPRDTFFTDMICVERKNSLDELAGNLTSGRTQFESEMLRAKGAGAKLHLMIEGGHWADLVMGRYRSELSSNSFVATLGTYMARYGLSINFVLPGQAGTFIALVLQYHCREYLRGGLEGVAI